MSIQSPFLLTTTKNMLRAILVIFTAAIALIAPYFGSVLGTVGGLTDALQSFILPPLICLAMARGPKGVKMRTSRKVFNGLVMVWGTGIISYTVVNIINEALYSER